MATLGTARSPRPAGSLVSTLWKLSGSLDAYSRPQGPGLATQVAGGRHFRVLDDIAELPSTRLRVRLLEDGYPCWLSLSDLLDQGELVAHPPLPRPWDRLSIEAAIPAVLAFAEQAMAVPNRYLWGGTLGPDFDCSGLVQTAFARSGIWLPRDAYLQERFCRPVAVQPGQTSLLQPGDLIFFGPSQRCTHVGVHLGGGRYLHSSGQEHGRNGLGVDDLSPANGDPVATHYRLTLRGAGRVMHSHDGSALPP
jgi:hypothetical protein